MATKAERAKSEAQKTGRGGRASTKKPPSGLRPSRVSTRKRATRTKTDAARNITEEVRKGAPTQRARKARARASHVRGS